MRLVLLFSFLVFSAFTYAQDSLFSSLEEAIKQPLMVKELNLQKKGLEFIPLKEIGEMPNLRTLDLSRNRIAALPKDWSALLNLESLDLSSNRIKEIPKSIAILSSLKLLDLSGNELTYLPQEISNMNRLEQLLIHSNKLGTLPIEIGKLTNLKLLDIRGDQLKDHSKKELKNWFQQTIKVKKSSGCNC